VIRRFLEQRPDLECVPFRPPPELDRFITAAGHFRTWPFRDLLEPFFAAMLVKTKDLRYT
jgi:16S rRNA C967 or C1407 C5-methylase (RsmB/RsmF family)